MSFNIVTIPFHQLVPDPMKRPYVYLKMIKWCEDNVDQRHQTDSPHFWFVRAFRGRTGVYKFHFKDQQDCKNFIQEFELDEDQNISYNTVGVEK